MTDEKVSRGEGLGQRSERAGWFLNWQISLGKSSLERRCYTCQVDNNTDGTLLSYFWQGDFICCFMLFITMMRRREVLVSAGGGRTEAEPREAPQLTFQGREVPQPGLEFARIFCSDI